MAQKKLREASVSISADEQKERVAFAALVGHLVRGEMHALLQDAPVGVCEKLGRIWDAQSHVPVGVLFQRPKFEEYEALHQAEAQQTMLN